MMKFTVPFSQLVDPKEVFKIQSAQYRDTLLLTGTVVAGTGGTDFPVNVSNEGHFFCQYITGSFECLYNTGAIVDTGVCYLAGQLRDGSRNLFQARVPLDLFLTPGRTKSGTSTTVVTDPAGNPLYEPLRLEHMFKVNTNIIMNVSNTSNVNNNFWIAFHGIRIIDNAVADQIRTSQR